MKKLFSVLTLLSSALVILAFMFFSETNAQKTITHSEEIFTENQKPTEVKAYYFHATRRCETCIAVEAVSKEAIKEYYGDKVSFESINIENENENSLIKKHQIGGQTLLIIKGEKVVDLTNDAFLNALTNPDKLKSKIKSTIDSML